MRHSFEQFCRDGGVDSAIIDQLQAHAQQGMRAVYGKGYNLTSLYQAIQNIEIKGLRLPV